MSNGKVKKLSNRNTFSLKLFRPIQSFKVDLWMRRICVFCMWSRLVHSEWPAILEPGCWQVFKGPHCKHTKLEHTGRIQSTHE